MNNISTLSTLGNSTNFLDIAQFMITIAVAITAIITTIISVKLFSSQTNPEVIVYAHTEHKTPTILYLTIKNIGNSSAYDVQFETPKGFPFVAFGIGTESEHKIDRINEGAFITGIPQLEPNGTRTCMWGQYGGIKQALDSSHLTITTKYRSNESSLLRKKRTLSYQSRVDIESFAHIDAGDNDPLNKCAKALEKMSKAIDHSSRNFRPFHIAVTDSITERNNKVRENRKSTSEEQKDS